jgi:uncharacterized protein
VSPRQAPAIDGFGPGGFRIAGAWRDGSVLILDDEVRAFGPRTLLALAPEDLDPVLAAADAVEFVLLGVGARTAPAPRAVRQRLFARSLGLEVASTPEACRLYNVLAGEGRRLAAALIAL